jgi:EmrB/QacA subfamily drug resistance transporter
MTTTAKQYKPWPALWALIIGFFMILIDTTIVSVANPAIQRGLKVDSVSDVLWVTSAYLLAYAVPLLVTGRLGDRFGPKNLYLGGLVIFTLASAWCGFSQTLGMLILARVIQGLGAALMTPQTMAVITRIFPPQQRGSAMALWGATAGAATLVGPILGGVLVDALGWEWIFFINVPIGIVAFILAARLVPKLPTHPHRFDIIGVVLSAIGLFLVVFGLQEGQTYNWGTITGSPFSVWGLIIAGVVVLAAFVVWQRFNRGEPLLPLTLFRDRNFSLANAAITTVGFAITSMTLPLIYFFQVVRGLTPTESALMLVPMAVITIALSAPVGKLVNRINPKYIAFVGLLFLAISLVWYSLIISPTVGIGWLLLPSALLGLANAGIWSPISNTATRNLPQKQAGAGSGVYNTTRQIGAVLGSASIAALISGRLAAHGITGGGGDSGAVLPAFLQGKFTDAMAETMLLPAAVAVLGALVVIFFAKPKQVTAWSDQIQQPAAEADATGASAAPAVTTAASTESEPA